MAIEDILEEMENLILESARLPFTNKRVIEEDDLALLMDQLREAMPSEIKEAKRLLADRARILDDANKEGQKIIEQAKTYGMKLTDENIITRQAQEHANEIIGQAQKSAQELRCSAVQYADDVFKYLESSTEKTLETVRQGHLNLIKNNKQNG